MTDQLPQKSDFVEYPGDLDQECAWQHFGGLTLEEAKSRFAENPLRYQEDFMFMGTGAFLFYFPVLDDHLRNTPEDNEFDDNEAWIIAHCIKNQIESDETGQLRPIIPAIVDLAVFVRENIDRFENNGKEGPYVITAWRRLLKHIQRMQGT